MSIIFLVGMSGCGKTYWANKLAKQHGLDMVDIDRQIRILTGKPVASIFDEKGETYFREMETGLLKQIIKGKGQWKAVVACGGGMPAHNDNMKVMLDNGCVVYLEADTEVLTERLQNDVDDRPLLRNGDLLSTLQSLFPQREHFYKQAHYTLNANNLSISDFDKIIESCIKRV